VIREGRTSPFSLVAARDGDVYSVDEWDSWTLTGWDVVQTCLEGRILACPLPTAGCE
jgi:hypothetical protein